MCALRYWGLELHQRLGVRPACLALLGQPEALYKAQIVRSDVERGWRRGEGSKYLPAPALQIFQGVALVAELRRCPGLIALLAQDGAAQQVGVWVRLQSADRGLERFERARLVPLP